MADVYVFPIVIGVQVDSCQIAILNKHCLRSDFMLRCLIIFISWVS